MAGTLYSFGLRLDDYFTSGFKKLNSALNNAKPAISSLNSAFGQFNSKLTSFGAAATASLAAYGIVNYAQEAVKNAAMIDDQLANVGKTTGLVGQDLENFYQRLGKIDTRTTAQGLLDIATVGGKMGVAKDAIFGFTTAVDKLNVALGDEFSGGPSQIAEVVGKMYNNFKQFEGMSYETAFLKIGSAMNALADSGIASAPYLAQFANSVSAGNKVLSLDTILSFGAALEETGLSADIAASGFQSFAAKVSSNMGDVSKFMGITEKDIMSLLNTDAGQVSFVEMFAKKFSGAGFAQTNAVLKTLGLADQETIKVFQNLAAQMEKPAKGAEKYANRLEQLMAISKREIAGAGDSINAEFKRKNETLAAQLEKTQKNVFALSREVGVAIAPLTSVFAELFSSFTEVAIPAVRAFGNFVKTDLYPKLASMMTPVKQGFEWVNQNWVTVKNAFVGFGVAIGIATVAFAALNITMLANPAGLVAAAIVGLAAAFSYAWATNGEFSASMMASWEVGKLVFSGLFEIAKVYLGGIWELLKGVGNLMMGIFNMDFTQIVEGFKGLDAGVSQMYIGVASKAIEQGGILANLAPDAAKKGYSEQANSWAGDMGKLAAGGKMTDQFKLPELAKSATGGLLNLQTPTAEAATGGGLDAFLAQGGGKGTAKGKGKAAAQGGIASPNATSIESGAGGGGGTKNITINIQSLVENFTISTQNIKGAPERVKQAMTDVLLSVLNDSQTF